VDDIEAQVWKNYAGTEYVPADLARTLARQLAEAQADQNAEEVIALTEEQIANRERARAETAEQQRRQQEEISERLLAAKETAERALESEIAAHAAADKLNTQLTAERESLRTRALKAEATHDQLHRSLATANAGNGLLRQEVEARDREIAAKQAHIDRLMLEFCPEEMTPEQLAEWGKHQAALPRDANG